jgi:Zn-dependent protease
VTNTLPGLRFSLLRFPVTVGLDFFLITAIIALQARTGVYILEWIAVVAVSILIHELGHALAFRRYHINPEIRLWGMGGLTMSGFALPPRKSLLVSLAGPAVGIPVALVVMVVQPWIPSGREFEAVRIIASDLVFINLFWGVLNLLPISGLDGGNSVLSIFEIAMGERGRRPGLIVVGICSVIIAVAAVAMGFIFLAIVIGFFALMNPEAYLALWHTISGDRRYRSTQAPNAVRGRYAGVPSSPAPRPTVVKRDDKRGKEPSAIQTAATSRRSFGETYLATIPDAAGGADPEARDAFIDELESRPEPLLPDVTGMIARRDDPAVGVRLAAEDDPVAILEIVARVAEAKRTSQLLSTLRRGEVQDGTSALLKLQVGLHALGRFEDSLAAASLLGRAGGSMSAILEARSAARLGDGKRTAAALERATGLGGAALSDAALGDIVRLGPDARVADLLNKLRNAGRVN